MSLWRWFWGMDDGAEYHALRARCEALGFALPRSVTETIGDRVAVAARKRRATCWRHPEPGEQIRYEAIVDVFADGLHAVATPDGETWLLGERLFCGFPNPDQYMVVFLGTGNRVIGATEMSRLPRRWTVPVEFTDATKSSGVPTVA